MQHEEDIDIEQENANIITMKELFYEKANEKGIDIDSYLFLQDDEFLRRFLIAKKDPERSCETLVNYVEFIHTICPWETTWDEIVANLQWLWSPVPLMRDAEGRLTVIFRLRFFFPDKLSFETAALQRWLTQEHCLAHGVEDQRRGFHVILDAKGVGWDNMDMKLQRKIGEVLENAIPFRVKKVTILNAPWIFQKAFKIARQWLPKKVKKRLSFEGKDDMEELFGENFSKLDVSYGGSEEWIAMQEDAKEELKQIFEHALTLYPKH
eukprot:TRINITY_DN1959_c0_g1_i1.p1 TRINITY_DN1959_c0_g1~~TRINITY_DN1959_c0_g1_i1.p1  ORF type:complete len:278 (+),score=58.63 TRINITY_DN1959_c0_g1_i1:38-835(+)